MKSGQTLHVFRVVSILGWAMALAHSQSQTAQAAIPQPVVRTTLKLVTVLTAAKLSEELGTNVQDYWAETAPPGQSVYSVALKFDRPSWSDLLSRPDIYLVIECEGSRRIVIPEVQYNWDYSTKIYTFRCPTLQPGSKCVLQLCDDDGEMDVLLKNFLMQKYHWQIKASAKSAHSLPGSGVGFLEGEALADGTMQLLQPGEASKLKFNAPEIVATATFIVPSESDSDKWEMSGQFLKEGTDMGSVTLTHWYTNPLPTIVGYLWRPQLLFWSVLLVGLVLILGVTGLRKRRSRIPSEIAAHDKP